ncbi:unnamed protein product, partial [Callosobruchus maculatus]
EKHVSTCFESAAIATGVSEKQQLLQTFIHIQIKQLLLLVVFAS